MKRILEKSPDIIILTEFSPLSMLEAGGSAVQYIEFLRHFQLEAYRINHGIPEHVDAQGLIDNCMTLENERFAEFVRECKNLNSAQVFDLATRFATDSGYVGPIIENIVFMRPNHPNL